VKVHDPFTLLDWNWAATAEKIECDLLVRKCRARTISRMLCGWLHPAMQRVVGNPHLFGSGGAMQATPSCSTATWLLPHVAYYSLSRATMNWRADQ
jgi:hypothetical protein